MLGVRCSSVLFVSLLGLVGVGLYLDMYILHLPHTPEQFVHLEKVYLEQLPYAMAAMLQGLTQVSLAMLQGLTQVSLAT